MTDYDYEATIETDDATFTFKGDDARTVSGQIARMPVVMHGKQVENRIDLNTQVNRYLEQIAQEEKEGKKQKRRTKPRHRARQNDE